MDRQQVSPDLHSRLLALEQSAPAPKQSSRRRWIPLVASAACLCLALGLWRLASPARSSSDASLVYSSESSADTSAVEYNDSETEEAVSADTAEEIAEVTTEEDTGLSMEETTEEAWEEEAAEDEVSSEDASAAQLTPPADAPLPGWLPDGYQLTGVETTSSGGILTWTGADGGSITLSYCYTEERSPESAWPTWDWETADWETISEVQAQDGVWGFALYHSELHLWCQLTTTGSDYEALWQMAQSILE